MSSSNILKDYVVNKAVVGIAAHKATALPRLFIACSVAASASRSGAQGISSAMGLMGLTICGGSSHLKLYKVELELKLVPEEFPISVGSQSRASVSCTRPIRDGARHTTTYKPACHVFEIYELIYLLYRMYRQSSHEPYHLCAPWWTALAGMGCAMSHHGRERRSEPRNSMGVLLAEGMGINFLTVASLTAIGV